MLENETIARAKKGDRLAQRRLYDQHSKGWFGVCLRYNRNRADAEDVLQNAMVKIYTKMDQFDPGKSKFITWSSRIVINENLQFLKNKRSFQELNDYEKVGSFEDDSKENAPLNAEELTKMIQKLPIGYRTVFNLYVMEGYTHQEISEILDISVGTSKSQLSKSKQMLRKNIEVLL